MAYDDSFQKFNIGFHPFLVMSFREIVYRNLLKLKFLYQHFRQSRNFLKSNSGLNLFGHLHLPAI